MIEACGLCLCTENQIVCEPCPQDVSQKSLSAKLRFDSDADCLNEDYWSAV
jgi:hypothetical protein